MTTLTVPVPRKIFLKNIFDPETQEIIDKGLCLWFPGELLLNTIKNLTPLKNTKNNIFMNFQVQSLLLVKTALSFRFMVVQQSSRL